MPICYIDIEFTLSLPSDTQGSLDIVIIQKTFYCAFLHYLLLPFLFCLLRAGIANKQLVESQEITRPCAPFPHLAFSVPSDPRPQLPPPYHRRTPTPPLTDIVLGPGDF